MRKVKWHFFVLALIFLGVVGFRLFFSLQVEGFTGDDAYATLRQLDFISENYSTMGYDELGYGGRALLVSPLFYFFLAFMKFFASDFLVFKVLPEVLMGLVVVVVFFITYEMTKNNTAALFASLISGFIPLVVETTLNSISIYSLFLLLFLLLFYFLIKIIQGGSAYVDWFVFLSFLLPLLHPAAFIFILSLVFYGVLMVSESIKVKTITKELAFFSIFLVLLVEFIIFKEAFLEHGFSLIQYNLPSRVIENYFVDFSLFSLLYSVGIVSFILGSMGIYIGFFKSKNQNVFLFIGIILAVLLLLLFKFIDFFNGLLFLGIAFSILAGFSLKYIYAYFARTKIPNVRLGFNVVLLLAIFFLGIVPSYAVGQEVVNNGVAQEEIVALQSLEAFSGGAVLADIEEGNLVNYYSGKKTMLDSNFLLVDNPNFIVREAKLIFLGASEALTKERLEENGIKYVYFSFRTRERYNVNSFLYGREECVEVLSENEKYQLFRIEC